MREFRQRQEKTLGKGMINARVEPFLLRWPWWQLIDFCGWIPVCIHESRQS